MTKLPIAVQRRIAEVFRDGAQANIAGEPFGACPYPIDSYWAGAWCGAYVHTGRTFAKYVAAQLQAMFEEAA